MESPNISGNCWFMQGLIKRIAQASVDNPNQVDSDNNNIGDACDLGIFLQQMEIMFSTVDSLVEQNEDLKTQIENLSDDYISMEQRIQYLESKVDTLQNENNYPKDQITALEGMVIDHSPIYFTGEGSGHNKIQVLMGPATFPAAPEQNPPAE